MSEHLTILSVNVNRSLVTLTALLETSIADILLIQEPYWGPLVPRRSDTDPDGTPVTGTVNHQAWQSFHPPPSTENYPRVATFVRSEVATSTTTTILPFIDSYYSVGVLLTLPSPLPTLTVINFYHHVDQKQPQLDRLLACTIPTDIATIICGDFNTHSLLWSPGDI